MQHRLTQINQLDYLNVAASIKFWLLIFFGIVRSPSHFCQQTPQVSFSLKQPQKYSQPGPKNRICEMKIYQNEQTAGLDRAVYFLKDLWQLRRSHFVHRNAAVYSCQTDSREKASTQQKLLHNWVIVHFSGASCRNNGEASSPVTSWEYSTRNCVV